MELGNLFKFKDVVDDKLKNSRVIYRINCRDCEKFYIGKTERILHYRLKEHRSCLTSAVFQHSREVKHVIDYDNIQILDKATSDRKLQIKEVFYIDKLKPPLNTQLNSQSRFRVKTRIFGSKKPVEQL